MFDVILDGLADAITAYAEHAPNDELGDIEAAVADIFGKRNFDNENMDKIVKSIETNLEVLEDIILRGRQFDESQKSSRAFFSHIAEVVVAIGVNSSDYMNRLPDNFYNDVLDRVESEVGVALMGRSRGRGRGREDDRRTRGRRNERDNGLGRRGSYGTTRDEETRVSERYEADGQRDRTPYKAKSRKDRDVKSGILSPETVARIRKNMQDEANRVENPTKFESIADTIVKPDRVVGYDMRKADPFSQFYDHHGMEYTVAYLSEHIPLNEDGTVATPPLYNLDEQILYIVYCPEEKASVYQLINILPNRINDFVNDPVRNKPKKVYRKVSHIGKKTPLPTEDLAMMEKCDVTFEDLIEAARDKIPGTNRIVTTTDRGAKVAAYLAMRARGEQLEIVDTVDDTPVFTDVENPMDVIEDIKSTGHLPRAVNMLKGMKEILGVDLYNAVSERLSNHLIEASKNQLGVDIQQMDITKHWDDFCDYVMKVRQGMEPLQEAIQDLSEYVLPRALNAVSGVETVETQVEGRDVSQQVISPILKDMVDSIEDAKQVVIFRDHKVNIVADCSLDDLKLGRQLEQSPNKSLIINDKSSSALLDPLDKLLTTLSKERDNLASLVLMTNDGNELNINRWNFNKTRSVALSKRTTN